MIIISDTIPVVPARGRAEVALGLYYKTFLIYRTGMRRVPARPVRACFVRSCCAVLFRCCCTRTWPARDHVAMQPQTDLFRLHTALFTPRTSHFAHLTSSHLKPCELFSPHLSSSYLIPPLLTCHLSVSRFFSSSQLFSFHPKMINLSRISWKFFSTQPLCTTKLAQSTSHYHFVLQSLYKARPSTTLYYKACTHKVLLSTTSQSTSQYYFALQSLHKALPSTTSYYEACTKQIPVLLCTTKLARSTSQYYFVLQSLYKARPSTTLCYKA